MRPQQRMVRVVVVVVVRGDALTYLRYMVGFYEWGGRCGGFRWNG
jgi:hypothetical protein